MVLLARFIAASACLSLAAWAHSQDAAQTADPRDFGIELTPGPVLPGEQQAVTTNNNEGRPVIGRVHVRVGSGAIILMPDGQLFGRREGEFSPTDRKFKPLDRNELAKRLAVEFSGFRTKSTNHYVYVYNTSDEFQFGTGRILESMLPGIKKWAETCKIDVKNPAVPLVVVMFRTEAEFRRHRRMPPGVVAYYEPVSNRVYMYEQSRLSSVRPDLALGQAISTVAHEGVHQILHNIGVQQRLSIWPMWLSEGLAEFFAPTTVGKNLKWKGAGHVNDVRMFELEQYVRGKAAEGASGEMVEHTVLAGPAQLSSLGYATSWALVHFLDKAKRPELVALVREASNFAPLTGATDVSNLGVVRSNREAFSKQLGSDFKSLETQIIEHLKSLPYNDPLKDAPHFVATFEAGSGRRLQRSASTFHFLPLAEKWLGDMRQKLPTAEQAAAKTAIRDFDNRALAEAFMRQWQNQ
jgi:hypothetical protein